MKIIVRVLIVIAVFWIFSSFFPDYLTIQDNITILVAGGVVILSGLALGLLILLSALLIPVGIGCLTIIPALIAALFCYPITLIILDKYLDGFDIHGFWTYVVLSLLLYTTSINVKVNTTTGGGNQNGK